MEVEIISKESIKPSSPTPCHLRIFKLSVLDLLIPAPYAPIILFYPAGLVDVPKRLESLKKSLSNTLTRFYPLAGEIKDDLSIDCNDQGAHYVEARVHCSLRQFLSKPDLLLLHRFLPCELVLKESDARTNYVTNIQINVFECGGIAIGICISHKILDGSALSTFLKAWASTARCCKQEIVQQPNFQEATNSLFPTNDLWLRDTSIVMFGSLFRKGKCVTKRFVFDASAISILKARASSERVQQPTRIEAVSGFLWQCVIAASKAKHGSPRPRPSLATHLVNLRRRVARPLLDSEYCIGNLLWMAAAKSPSASAEDDEEGLRGLVSELRDALSKVDSEYVKRLLGEEGNSVMCECLKEIGEEGSKEGVDCLGFSSWCNFGFYETDFGWGKPVWVSSVGSSGSVFMNLVILVETRLGDGIEAWVSMDEPDMAQLECKCNQELLNFVSVDPSPF